MTITPISRCLRRLAPALMIVALADCGPFRRSAGPPGSYLVFTNEALQQASVYIAVPGLDARRIGTVMPGRTDTLTVPVDLATRGGSLSVVARLQGGSVVQTGPVSIRPGEYYQVRLPLDGRLLSFLPGG